MAQQTEIGRRKEQKTQSLEVQLVELSIESLCGESVNINHRYDYYKGVINELNQ